MVSIERLRCISMFIHCDAKIGLVCPLAVVVWPRTLRLAAQAATMLFLRDAARIVEGDSGVLLRAWVIAHARHALLVRHNMWICASCTRILLDVLQFLLLDRSKAHFTVHIQEGAQ